MDIIVLATHNPKKVVEFSGYFQNYKFKTLVDMGITEIPEESGNTFAKNAKIKATAACKATGEICLADDSGLCVDALGGEPGVLSARFGNLSSDTERNEYLLKLLKDTENRTAHFECAICVIFPSGREIIAQGRCDGYITQNMCGNKGFGYDSIFFSHDLQCTFAESELEKKSKVSHRGRALSELKKVLDI